jgi:hypothetical protein
MADLRRFDGGFAAIRRRTRGDSMADLRRFDGGFAAIRRRI